MGRKKAEEPALDPHGRATVINLKGSLDDREWIDALSRRTMIPASRIVRAALADWARKHKYPAPPWADEK